MRSAKRHVPWLLLLAVMAAVLLRVVSSGGVTAPAASGAARSLSEPAASVAASAATSAAAPPSEFGTGHNARALIRAVVSRNVDGDTIHVTMPEGSDEKVRFIGVNTPESTIRHEPYGKEASDYTKRRLPVGRVVWLETDVQQRDRYGRILAYIWMTPPAAADAADVRAHMFNAELLLQGYAQLMTIPPDVAYADVFRPMQAEARDADRGLWALPAK